MKQGARLLAGTLLWIVVALCLTLTIVPRFLDRVYYRGPASTHFDGARFFNPDGGDDVLAHGTGSLWGRLIRQMDRPAWPSRVAVRQATPPARVTGEAMLATWVGHATVLVQTGGLNILTDPIWSDTAGPFGVGPRRVTAPGVAWERLPPIDLVLVSHNHYDHMDLATLKRLWARDRPAIVVSPGNDAILRSAGIPSIALDWGQGLQRTAACQAGGSCPTIDVTVTRNHHWSSRWFTDRNRALWSSFTVKLPGGNLFFAGDTGMGDGKWADEAARLGPVRLAILPIGAFRFNAGEMATGSHIGPVDAVEVYRRLGASRALSVHWGTFRLSSEAYSTPPRLLGAALRCTGQQGFTAPPIGVPQVIPAYAPPPSRPMMARAALLACLDTPAVRALR